MTALFCRSCRAVLLLVSLPFVIDRVDAQQQESSAPEVTGQVTAVTLYRDSALVTRRIELPAGVSEIVVTGLPEQLQPASVYAEADDGLAIRGVRAVTVPTDEPIREDVQNVDRQIEEIQRQIDLLTAQAAQIDSYLASINGMSNFSQAAADRDLGHGVLDADAAIALVDAAHERRTAAIEQKMTISTTIEDQRRQLDRLQRERQKIASSAPLQSYHVRIYTDASGDQPHTLRLLYSVAGCSWEPQYIANATSEQDMVRLRFNALINQTSGENWEQVDLTLSTASPAVSAAGPQLASLRAKTVEGGVAQVDASGAFGAASEPFGDAPNAAGGAKQVVEFNNLRQMQRSLEKSASRDDAYGGNSQRDSGLNRFATQLQSIELQASEKTAETLASETDAEVTAQTYDIESPVTLEGRRDSQLVEIARLELTGDMIFVATPLLSSYVYRQFESINNSPLTLLEGPATAYLDDRFVGNLQIPSTAIGQRLEIGFGADDQLRTRRELVDKSDSIQGGNRKVTFRYKLVINSFKESGIRVRLLDRIPVAEESEALRIDLEDPSQPLSDNPLYQRVRRPAGILRWDLEVPAGASGSDAFDVTYSYTAELARSQQMTVSAIVEEPLIPGMGGGMGGGLGH